MANKVRASRSVFLRALHLAAVLIVCAVADAPAQYKAPAQGRPTAQRPLLFVPSVIGSSADAAQERLQQFRVERREVPSVRAAGVVVSQEPRAPEQRRAGSLVRIDVSDGSRVLVPPVRQRKLADAQARMMANNLAVAIVERESEEVPGVVAAQNPVEGSEVARGSTVELIVSTGLSIPAVKGESLEEALRRLTRFKVQFTEIESGELKGTVVEQDPAAATRAAAGSRVLLEVSDGTRVAVPDLQSTTLGFARSSLLEAGLMTAVRNWPDHSDAIVKAQAPAARTQVRRGTLVELEVRPPTSWAIGAGAVLLLFAGYVGWLWKRPVPPRSPSPSPVRADVEQGSQETARRVEREPASGPAKPDDVSGRG